MKSAALDRLETLLRARQLDGTLTAAALKRLAAARTVSTGVPALDRLLDGGWRRGDLSEIVGGRSSGRTSVLVATLAAATARGEIVGLVDACDRFDPIGAAAAGVDLARVLWVRGPQILVEAARPSVVQSAVERALRALDLFVRAGGFAVAALDLADVPPRFVKALPFTTWMRLGHANEGRDTVCLLVGDAPMGRSPGGVSVRLTATSHWTGASPQSRRLEGLDVCPLVLSPRSNGPRHDASVPGLTDLGPRTIGLR